MKLATITLGALILAGCSSDAGTNSNSANGNSPAASTGTAGSPVTAPTAGEGVSGAPAGFEGTAGNTEKNNPDATGAALLKDVRSAGHQGHDRVVFEFEGAQLPSYKIEYVDKPVRACGSGDEVPFRGDAWLSVRFTGANAHTEAGEPTIKDCSRATNHTVVRDLKLICDFEAEVEWVLGVASPNKYRVLELKDPTRLVVDIRHDR